MTRSSVTLGTGPTPTGPAHPSSSKVCTGVVRHRRRDHAAHEFSMPIAMVLLDLEDESLRTLFRRSRVASVRGVAPVMFRQRDYLDPSRHLGEAARSLSPDAELAERVRALVQLEVGGTPAGPVLLLTQLRQFGMLFNPVSFFYCFEGDGGLHSIVAEITNTPWRQRHAYVLPVRDAQPAGRMLRWRFAKRFHVSPLVEMDIDYDWSFSVPVASGASATPDDELLVHMNLVRPPRSRREPDDAGPLRMFDATLRLRPSPATPSALRWTHLRYPLQAAQTLGRIYYEAMRTWRKGAQGQPTPAGLLPDRPTSFDPGVGR